jgi:uncharacterized protein (UPF0332 family)
MNSFDWSHYLRLADGLSQQPEAVGPEEASYRAAISRAYYGAFCAARNYARDHDGTVVTSSVGDHLNIINHFRRSSEKSRKKIGIMLDTLRDRRNKADYSDVLAGVAGEAHVSVMEAQDIFKVLNTLK